MSNRVKQYRLSQYHFSNIEETHNNRIIDLGESFLALLADIPIYVAGATRQPMRVNSSDSEQAVARRKPRSSLTSD